MTSSRPYLFRAFYDWIVDNEQTPHVLVDAELVGVEVPRAFVDDGQIVLNVAPHACGDFNASNTAISFNARFQGKVENLYIPFAAVKAIYARESGAGSVFEDEFETEDTSGSIAEETSKTSNQSSDSKKKVSHLSLVK